MSVWVAGSINLDLVARTALLPAPGETVMATGLERRPGGKGANQAVAAARAGAATRLIGRVGADAEGEWLLAFLEAAGLDLGAVARNREAPTGQAFITVSDDGENCIVVVAGANARLSASAVGGAGETPASVLLAQLETNLQPIEALFRSAVPGCWKIINAAPAKLEARSLFVLADLLIFNETELAAYAGVTPGPPDARAIEAAARSILTRPGQQAVVTLGANGALLVAPQGAQHIAGRRVHAVDTVGAGDCFCGVLAAGLDAGLDLSEAIGRANVAAALAVTRSGAASAMPTKAEIDAAFLSSS